MRFKNLFLTLSLGVMVMFAFINCEKENEEVGKESLNSFTTENTTNLKNLDNRYQYRGSSDVLKEFELFKKDAKKHSNTIKYVYDLLYKQKKETSVVDLSNENILKLAKQYYLENDEGESYEEKKVICENITHIPTNIEMKSSYLEFLEESTRRLFEECVNYTFEAKTGKDLGKFVESIFYTSEFKKLSKEQKDHLMFLCAIYLDSIEYWVRNTKDWTSLIQEEKHSHNVRGMAGPPGNYFMPEHCEEAVEIGLADAEGCFTSLVTGWNPLGWFVGGSSASIKKGIEVFK